MLTQAEIDAAAAVRMARKLPRAAPATAPKVTREDGPPVPCPKKGCTGQTKYVSGLDGRREERKCTCGFAFVTFDAMVRTLTGPGGMKPMEAIAHLDKAKRDVLKEARMVPMPKRMKDIDVALR